MRKKNVHLCFSTVFASGCVHNFEMGKRKAVYRPKKVNFRGNRHTTANAIIHDSPNLKSASAKKLPKDCGNSSSDFDEVNIIFNINIMLEQLEKCLRCVCGGNVKLSMHRIVGLGCNVTIVCQKCGVIGSFDSCHKLGTNNHVYSINRRVIYAMRCLGQGLAGLGMFCGLMNLPPPVKKSTYSLVYQRILVATNQVAKESLSKAAEGEASLTGSRDVSVSCDGTWLTRGHSSLDGVCTVIGAKTGKVIDIEVLSSSCKRCDQWKGKTGTLAYQEWWEVHEEVCDINHKGSAGSMEVEGMKMIFSRSSQSQFTVCQLYWGWRYQELQVGF